MLRAVRLSILPSFKTQIKSVDCLKHLPFQRNVNSFRWSSTNFNFQAWHESLDEAQQKRIRHIQNEVR